MIQFSIFLGENYLKKVEVLVLGAGASGLMFASLNKNKNILVIEKNNRMGRKIIVSGGGKCNLTNRFVSEKNYLGESKFIKDVLNGFTNRDVLKYFEEVDLVVKKKNQFFCKNSAVDIVKFFEKRVKSILFGCEVLDVEYINKKFLVKTTKGNIETKKLVVASGGLSFKELGSSDIAFKIAKKFGHNIKTLNPALVGFTLQRDDFWMKELSGVSLKVKIKVDKKIFYDDMLFTHRGISGPAILNSSLYWDKGFIEIDFLPNQNIELKKSQKQISSNLSLPKRFIKEFLKSISLEDLVVSKLKKDELEKLKILKNYKLSPAGNFGYKKAEVTKGGIDTKEIDVNSMESKKIRNLYFVGECLDVTGELGGYNFQWAFSSANRVKL